MDPQDIYDGLVEVAAHIKAGRIGAALGLLVAMRAECVEHGAEQDQT